MEEKKEELPAQQEEAKEESVVKLVEIKEESVVKPEEVKEKSVKPEDVKVEEKKELQKELITPESSIFPEYFKDQSILKFKCEACGKIPFYLKNIEATCCGHLYCESCIKKKQSVGENCPFCKKSFETNPQSKIISHLLSDYIISCPNKCSWSGKWEELEEHFTKCDKSFRYCKYQKFGCDFFGTFRKCIEHEDEKDKEHFELVMKYNEENVIQTDIKVRFDNNYKYRVKVHDHPLTFMASGTWTCNGVKLPGGCLSPRPEFRHRKRFRCDECDFDLCPYCMMKYVIEDSK